MSLHFLLRFGRRLCLEYYFTDWLVASLRYGKKTTVKDYIRSDYLVASGTNSFDENKAFVLLLMLLQFTSQLDYKIDLLGSTSYRRITFSLQTFSKYVEPACKPTNHYRLKIRSVHL